MNMSIFSAKGAAALIGFIIFAVGGVASAQYYNYGGYGAYQNVYSYPSYSYGYGSSYGYGGYCPQLYSDLRFGMRGGEVTSLQQFFASRYGQLVTGYFGAQTYANVLRFQNEQRLYPTGIVDYSTRSAIARSCGGYGYPYPDYDDDYDRDYDGEITLNEPSGGETFDTSDEINIEWELEDEPRNSYVRLELFDDRDRRERTIATVSSRDDEYEWNIPSSLDEGEYYIRATLYAQNGTRIDYDESDEFEIQED